MHVCISHMGCSYSGEKSSGQNELFTGPALQTESDRSRVVATGVYKNSVISHRLWCILSFYLIFCPLWEWKEEASLAFSSWRTSESEARVKVREHIWKRNWGWSPTGKQTAFLLLVRPTSPRQLSDLINHFLFSMRSLQLWEWSPLSWGATTTWVKG